MNKIIHGRIPAILLALLLTVTSLPLTAFADTLAKTPESMPTVDEASEPVDILTENVSETEPENIQPEQNEDEAFNPETENQTEEESEPLSEDAVQAIAELYSLKKSMRTMLWER